MATNEITALKVKWTVSRGRDTYGYNICSLWEKTMYKTKYGYTSCNYHKAFSCSGGGYDMLGTVLGEFIEKRYQGELVMHSRLLPLLPTLP